MAGLETKFQVTNQGFRQRKTLVGKQVMTFQQLKEPVNPLYIKRKIRADGNNTFPICDPLTPYRWVLRQRQEEEEKKRKERKKREQEVTTIDEEEAERRRVMGEDEGEDEPSDSEEL